ncbi:MAG: hypothetical protein HYS80_02565 [Candidatus Aenigmarchaeota archaeon]|nr:hypothetical protein [Candidatus Aenigmarchaeota archaeon]
MTVLLSQRETDVRSRASDPHPLNLSLAQETINNQTKITASWIQYPNQQYLYRVTDKNGKNLVLENTNQNEIILDLRLTPGEYSFTVVCTESKEPSTTRGALSCAYGTQDTLRFTVE